MEKLLNIVTAALVLAILALAFAAAAYGLPWLRAGSDMAEGTMTLRQAENGELLLTWPPSATAERYDVAVYALREDLTPEETPLFSAVAEGNSCLLPATLPEDRAVELRVGSRRSYRVPGEERVRRGETSLSVYCYLNRPQISDLCCAPDPDTDSVTLTWRGWQGDSYALYLTDGGEEAALLARPDTVTATLRFGADGDLPVPERGEDYTFVVEAARVETGLEFYGASSAPVTVSREDLLGREPALRCEAQGDNAYTLAWEETKGEAWLVQRRDPAGDWVTLREYGPEEPRRYDTGHLPSNIETAFRVAAVGGETLPDSEYAALSEELTVHTGCSTRYATVWPMKELPAASEPGSGNTVGTVPAAGALCVLDERDGAFLVRTGGGAEGWIDSRYCMINLPDYIGDLCSYDITNSYDSIYMVHDYAIPAVTGTVVEGYEHVLLDDGSFVVPLLYPTAKKLVTAAEAAAAEGLRLRIYDSFRPNRATRSIYDLTLSVLDEPLPAGTHLRRTLQQYLRGEAPAETAPAAGEETEERLSYRQMMTNGSYNLGSFLASGGSMHNLGIAMDLTLERAEDREELPAQTHMHDLSWYSAMWRNTENAATLDRLMKAAGFGSIGSEWWHFQDNEIRAALNLPLLWPGVSVEGWKRDDTGWRYRLPGGGWYAGVTVNLDGTDVRFDSAGYAQREA